MAAAARKIEPEEVSLERLALDEAAGDPPRAVEILTERILAEPDIVQAHLRDWARAWAHAKIHYLLAARRKAILRAVGNGETFANGLATAMSNEFSRLMDMPIFGGKRLGDATPDEVRESAVRYQAIANNNATEAQWHRKVADAAEAKGAGLIGELLTEEELSGLRNEADV